MEPILTFIIPIRHPQNARNWAELKQNLTQTIHSIAGQTSPEWKCIIVANTGSDLPELPEKFEVKWVDFPPNRHHERTDGSRDEFYNSFRMDKGSRVLAGMHHAGGSNYKGYFMIVDDDDFVSRDLVSFVKANNGKNGWYIYDGYVFDVASKLFIKYFNFSFYCGTSLIIHSDAYKLPPTIEETSEDYICKYLGSHTYMQKLMEDGGTPIEPLPFFGAVYRIGHAGAHSNSSMLKLIKTLFFACPQVFPKFKYIRYPYRVLKSIVSIRPVNETYKKQFTMKL